MPLALVTAPSSECLTLGEVRAHLRVAASDGEPAPTAPTLALAGLGSGNKTAGVYRGRCTFVTADGETDGGTISTSVTVADASVNGRLAWSGIPVGGSNVTTVRLYETVADGSEFKLAGSVANGVTTFADNVADASLGAGCPTTNTTEDPYLTHLLKTARRHLDARDGWLNRCFMTQTWDYFLDKFPSGEVLWLPLAPVQSITHVKYYDTSNTEQTWTSTNYQTDLVSEPGRIVAVSGVPWPSTYDRLNAVTVRMVCGYTTAALVPDEIKHAMRLLIGDWYENREAVGSVGDKRQHDLDRILWPIRMHPRAS